MCKLLNENILFELLQLDHNLEVNSLWDPEK